MKEELTAIPVGPFRPFGTATKDCSGEVPSRLARAIALVASVVPALAQ